MVDICPLCLESKTSFQFHHVIWRYEGGTDDPVNLLKICKSCHALLTFGNPEEACWYDNACKYRQLAVYGFDFVIRASELGQAKNNSLTNILNRIVESGKDWDNEWAFRLSAFHFYVVGLLVTTRRFTPDKLKKAEITLEDCRLILDEVKSKTGLWVDGFTVKTES